MFQRVVVAVLACIALFLSKRAWPDAPRAHRLGRPEPAWTGAPVVAARTTR